MEGIRSHFNQNWTLRFFNNPSSYEMEEIRPHFLQKWSNSLTIQSWMKWRKLDPISINLIQALDCLKNWWFFFFPSHISSGFFEEFLLPFSISYKLRIVEEMQRFKQKMEKLGDGIIRKKKLWIQTLSLIANVKKKIYLREERWSSVT